MLKDERIIFDACGLLKKFDANRPNTRDGYLRCFMENMGLYSPDEIANALNGLHGIMLSPEERLERHEASLAQLKEVQANESNS